MLDFDRGGDRFAMLFDRQRIQMLIVIHYGRGDDFLFRFQHQQRFGADLITLCGDGRFHCDRQLRIVVTIYHRLVIAIEC